MLVPVEARCTFETGFCGWQNTSEEMSLTWKLHKGDRQKFTGPKCDNTYKNRTGNKHFFRRSTVFLEKSVFRYDFLYIFFFFYFNRHLRVRRHVGTVVSRVGRAHGKRALSSAAAVRFRPAVEILQHLLRELYISKVVYRKICKIIVLSDAAKCEIFLRYNVFFREQRSSKKFGKYRLGVYPAWNVHCNFVLFLSHVEKKTIFRKMVKIRPFVINFYPKQVAPMFTLNSKKKKFRFWFLSEHVLFVTYFWIFCQKRRNW